MTDKNVPAKPASTGQKVIKESYTPPVNKLPPPPPPKTEK